MEDKEGVRIKWYGSMEIWKGRKEEVRIRWYGKIGGKRKNETVCKTNYDGFTDRRDWMKGRKRRDEEQKGKSRENSRQTVGMKDFFSFKK